VVGATKVNTVIAGQYPNISTMVRSAITFPVTVPRNATITNVSLILYLNSKTVTFGTPDMYISGDQGTVKDFQPMDSTNQVTGDWAKYYLGGTPTIYNATPVSISPWTASTRKQIYFNQAGITAVNSSRRYGNEANITISLRSQWDIENNNKTMVWTALTAQSGIYTFGSMQAVAHSQDPMLNISYYLPDSAGSSAPPACANTTANFVANITRGPSPLTVQFFDLSNNTPTSWKWDLTAGGTGTDDTVQNPVHVYGGGAGTYSINLTVNNSCGYPDSEVKTNYIVVTDAEPEPTPCPESDCGVLVPAGINTTFWSNNESIVYNQTSIVQNDNATPWWVWVLTAAVGIGLFVYSLIFGKAQMNDIAAILSLPFLLLASWQSFAVEFVTGYGTTGYATDTSNVFSMMELTSVYHFDFIGFIFFIWFLVGIANLYRIYTTPDRIA
jgi:PKD repeat protein